MNEFFGRFEDFLSTLSASPMLAIALTLGAFFAGNRIFRLLKHPVWLPPILISAMLVSGAIAVLAIDYGDYREGAQWLSVLLGPATVALGVPLYQQMHHIRAMWRPIVVTLPIAATMAAVYVVVIAWALGGTPEVLASLALRGPLRSVILPERLHPWAWVSPVCSPRYSCLSFFISGPCDFRPITGHSIGE